MNTNSKYGIPHERRPKDDEKTTTEVRPIVRWRLQLSNEVLLELIDWRVGDTEDYLQRSLRITPKGEVAEPINVEGLDVDAFLLVVSKLKPELSLGFMHPAKRRIFGKALKNKDASVKYP